MSLSSILKVSLWLLLCRGSAGQNVYSAPVPPSLRSGNNDPRGLRGQDKYTNLTIDQLILNSLGGMNNALGMLVQGDKILAELDMMLTEDQFLRLYEMPNSKLMMGASGRKRRKAVRETNLRWTVAEMAYEIVPGHFDDREKYFMHRAMTEWERYTCMRFKPAKYADTNRVRFQNGIGCNSQLGMVGGLQVLNLEKPGCRFKGLYLHEIGHALGLVHEHQLPNRDKFINIIYRNVQPIMRQWFNKYSVSEINQFNVAYEYSSVMHYGTTAFAFDGKSQTIQAKDSTREEEIGRVYRKELSFSDVKILNLMYKCGAKCPASVKCSDNGFVDQNCRCVCQDGTSSCQVQDRGERADQPGARCVNAFTSSWQCYVWARQGECDRNKEWMTINCNKACGFCGRGMQDPEYEGFKLESWGWELMGWFSDLIPKFKSMGMCKDRYPHDKCKTWMKRGDCLTNPSWMSANCKKACSFCNGLKYTPEINCVNTHMDDGECSKWALDGECFINPLWMKDNCQRACRMCPQKDRGGSTGDGDGDEDGDGDGDGDGDDDKDKAPCNNTHDDSECRLWTQSGECDANPTWMLKNCRKACNKCNDDGECKNLHNDKDCETWKRDDECDKNPFWMKRNCRLACGECKPVTGTRRTTTGTRTITRTRTTNAPRRTTTRKPYGGGGGGGGTSDDEGSCKNSHSSNSECEAWAKGGHCNRNPSWMKKNCKKSCGVCKSGSASEGTGTNGGDGGGNNNGGGDGGSSRGAECKDRNKKCAIWAKGRSCESNAGYMLRYCPKSCGNCKKKDMCKDNNQLCVTWGKGGQCSRNPGYMLRHCQKTCNVCQV